MPSIVHYLFGLFDQNGLKIVNTNQTDPCKKWFRIIYPFNALRVHLLYHTFEKLPMSFFFQSVFSKCDPRDPRFETLFDLAEVQEILGSYIYFLLALIQIYTCHLTLHKWEIERYVLIKSKKGNFKMIYLYDFEFSHYSVFFHSHCFCRSVPIYIPWMWIGGHTHIRVFKSFDQIN